MAGLPSCIETCKMSTPWPTPCWHATCHPSIVTKTWATCFQLKSSVQNTSTHPATPRITSTHVSYIPSAKMLMHRCTHACALLSSRFVEEFHSLAGTGLVLKWMPGETANETSKMMGAFLWNKTVEVFLHLLTSFVSCPGSSCWTWEAWCLFVLWKACVNIRVLTFTVHQDVGATLTSLPLTRIQEYNIPLAANKFSNFSPTHLNKPKTLSLLATRTSTNQFPVSYSSSHHSLPNDESPFSCDSMAGRCGVGRYNVMFQCFGAISWLLKQLQFHEF